MIVLDASVLIGYLFRQDGHHAAAVRVLGDGRPGRFAIPVLTLAEALVLPSRGGGVDQVMRILRAWDVLVLPLEGSEATGLADLRATSGLRMPDCVVLRAALTHGWSLATFDMALAAEAHRRGLTVLS